MIEQLTGMLDERQGELQALAVELRFDPRGRWRHLRLGAGDRRGAGCADGPLRTPRRVGDGAPARPFDVTEYTEALRQLGDTAQQLQVLLGQADSKAPALAQVSDGAADRLSSLVDHMYWRLVQLALVLVVASVLGALAYRAIVRRS